MLAALVGIGGLVTVIVIFALLLRSEDQARRFGRLAGRVGAGGDTSQVAAAVLIYRALTWALPILVGIGCYVWWRRQAWTTPAAADMLSALMSYELLEELLVDRSWSPQRYRTHLTWHPHAGKRRGHHS